MAHFAELDSQNVVVRVIVVGNKDCINKGKESESAGIAFCQSLFGTNTRWVQTSYSGSSRGKFAAIGDVYDREKNAFRPASPGPSPITPALPGWDPQPDPARGDVYEALDGSLWVWDQPRNSSGQYVTDDPETSTVESALQWIPKQP